MLILDKILRLVDLQISISRVKATSKDKEAKALDKVEPQDITSSIELTDIEIVDLEKLSYFAEKVPGMTDSKSGQFLFTSCYLQEEIGDVVEIGSWQGRSTSYLARAVELSGNGKMYAVDPFTGNTGKESFYIVGKDDLSDLKKNFESNIEKLGLSKAVMLLPMKSRDAAMTLKDNRIRYLFIDGDHSEEGVQTDLECFFPFLINGGIIVFDDFLKNATGLISAINRHVSIHKPRKIFTFKKTLILKY